jgi:murein DD-endopeptidase MepM/ murein hydrolase activator NlpD
VPHPRGRRLEWIVTRSRVRLVTTGLFVFLGLFVLLAAHRYVDLVRSLQGSQLQAQNEILRRDLLSLQERIDNLTIRMRGLSQTDRAMRVWTDIPDQVGAGRKSGVGVTDEVPARLDHVQPDMGGMILTAYSSLGRLGREAGLLRRSFEDILGEITRDKKLRDHTPSILPVPEDTDWYVSSGFGYRSDPITGLREFHNGIDIAGDRGTPVVATAGGVVDRVDRDRRIGNYIALNHGNGLRTLYGHLMSLPALEPGQEVARGDVIGHIGTTGRATGPHVHYIVSVDGRVENPQRYIFNSPTAQRR